MIQNPTTYSLKRKAFYQQFPHFFSDFQDPKLEYALYDILPLRQQQVDEIRFATRALWYIFVKVAKQFKYLSQEQLLLMGFREEMLPFLDLDYLNRPSVLARFDFICDDNGGIKAIELNGDTPFLIQETFEMNKHLCDEFQMDNPNSSRALMKTLSMALFSAVDYLGLKRKPFVVITGKEADIDFEEHCHVKYLQKKTLPFESVYEPIDKLRIVSEDNSRFKRGLYTADMKRIDILYRPAHPIEFLIDDMAADGDRIGLQLLELIKDRELAIINSPAAYILQSKLLMALIWERRNDPKLFTKKEAAVINRYMLPTYLSEQPFTQAKEAFVKKPIYSREGDTVEIYTATGEKRVASEYNHYTDNLYVYQKYVEMPDRKIELENGIHNRKWLIGSFIADDQACGLACRLGAEITDWHSHWMAVEY
jgi:glutathionylspermidine synthase